MAGFKDGKIETTHDSYDILCASSTNPGEFVSIDVGTAGQELRSNGVSAYPSMQTPGKGNNWTQIISGTLPDEATSLVIDDGLGTAYDEYLILVKNLDLDLLGDDFFNIHLSDDAGSTYAFDIATKGVEGGGTTGTSGTVSLTSQPLYYGGALDGDGSTANGSDHMWLYFSGNKTGNYKPFQSGSFAATSVTRVNWYFGVAKTNNDIDAIKFDVTGGGNFSSGTYTIRGR